MNNIGTGYVAGSYFKFKNIIKVLQMRRKSGNIKKKEQKGKKVRMSRTGRVKQDILKVLEDGREHYAGDIKKTIRQKYKEDITEGVFAGALRKLVLENKCKNPDRGVYVLERDTTNSTQEKKRSQNHKENKVDIELKQKIARVFSNMENELNSIMVDYNLSDTDTDTILYCLEVKKMCGDFREKLNATNKMI